MKRIAFSLGAITFVAAVAMSATGAFFSDTETSSGNTFTAGAIDLKVDSQSHYAGLICIVATSTQSATGFVWNQEGQTPTTRPDLVGTPCDGTWTQTDLGPSNKFFNFSDVKPGDPGEDTISLHNTGNDAWICANITVTGNAENTATTPEITAGDNTNNGAFDGELAQNVQFVSWLDNGNSVGDSPGVAGDNVHQAGEPILFGPVTLASGPTTGPVSMDLPLMDSTTETGPMAANGSGFIGLAWCAGTMTVNPNGSLSCNGATMGNQAQTDGMTASITLTAEQSRNNPNFTCGAVTTIVGPNDLESSLANATVSGKWYWYDDTHDVLNNSLGSFVAGPNTPFFGTGSAENNPLADGTGRTLFTNSGFGGVLLSSISQMSYGEYQPSGAWSSTEAPFFRFNVDFTGSNVFQKSLVFVPSNNGTVTQNTWQSWDMINGGNAMWLYSGTNWPAGNTSNGSIPGTTARKWADILADYPTIRMWQAGAQLGFRTGEPGPAGLTANIDYFKINTGSGTKLFNFGN